MEISAGCAGGDNALTVATLQQPRVELTREEQRVIAALRKALKCGRAELTFTIRRSRVVQCRLTEEQQWDREDN